MTRCSLICYSTRFVLVKASPAILQRFRTTLVTRISHFQLSFCNNVRSKTSLHWFAVLSVVSVQIFWDTHIFPFWGFLLALKESKSRFDLVDFLIFCQKKGITIIAKCKDVSFVLH